MNQVFCAEDRINIILNNVYIKYHLPLHYAFNYNFEFHSQLKNSVFFIDATKFIKLTQSVLCYL